MTALYLAGLGLLISLAVGYLYWSIYVTTGPIVYGNTRWRREAPVRAAAAERRAALDALTDDDRDWLIQRGWKPHNS